MKKLREILEFIMALLGFLLNLKRRKPDEGGNVLPGHAAGNVSVKMIV